MSNLPFGRNGASAIFRQKIYSIPSETNYLLCSSNPHGRFFLFHSIPRAAPGFAGIALDYYILAFHARKSATNGERKEVSEAMQIRDKAYTYLKLAVDEIRECGKFVFWRNPDRMKGYVSDYHKH